ncbi:MAG: LEA type 2 family protein [Methanoculleus sp.]|nr:LEA type 2 family protein [Methanoculleus sp.]
MWRPAVILLTAALLCSAGCAVPPLKEPTVTVDGIGIENVTWGSTDLSLRLIIDNPNPVGATLTRVWFDVHFLESGQAVYLAHGEQEGIEIRPDGETAVSIPVTVDNPPLVQAFLRGLQDGVIVLRVNGSGTLDYGIATFEVPFNRTIEVRPGQG